MYLMLHEARPAKVLHNALSRVSFLASAVWRCDLHIGESLRGRTSEWLIIKAETLQLSQAANFTLRGFLISGST